MSDTAIPSGSNRPTDDGAIGAVSPGRDGAPGLVPDGPGTSGTSGASGAMGMHVGGVRDGDPLRAVRDYLRLCGLPGGGAGGDDDNGAPRLPPSVASGSLEDLALSMQMMQADLSNVQAATSMAEIKTNTLKLKASQAEQNAHYKKAVDSARKAEAKSGGVLGFFKKLFKAVAMVAGVVLSALAVAATGGAAGPLMAFAVVGLVSATIGLANEISQAAGGPPISVSGTLSKLGTLLAKACGATDEKAESIGKVVGNAIGIAAFVIDPAVLGELAGGIAALSGADSTVAGIVSVVATLVGVIAQVGLSFLVPSSAMDSANKVAAMMAKMTGLKSGLSIAKGVADGAGSLVGATQGMLIAGDRRDVDMARADAKAAGVQGMQLQKQMDDLLDAVRKLFEQVDDGVRGATQMMNRASQSYQLLSRNMGGRVGA